MSGIVALTTYLAIAAGDPVAAAIGRAEVCDFDGALALLDQAQDFQRQSVPVRLMRARVLIQLEQGEKALSLLGELPAKAEFYSEGERHLLMALAAATAGKLPLAEAELNKARSMGADPDLVDGALGKVRLQAGKADEAESILRKVLSRKGAETMTGAIYNLAVLEAQRGRTFEAAGLLRLAWHLGHRNPKKIRSEKAFEKVVMAGPLVEDMLADEKGARCSTW